MVRWLLAIWFGVCVAFAMAPLDRTCDLAPDDVASAADFAGIAMSHGHARISTAPVARTILASASAVFSLDSVITAVGLTDQIGVMIAANVVALAVMLALGGRLSALLERHPSLKILALAILLMIGGVLVVEGLGGHIGKGYVYAAMAFALAVELMNLRARRGAAATSSVDPGDRAAPAHRPRRDGAA